MCGMIIKDTNHWHADPEIELKFKESNDNEDADESKERTDHISSEDKNGLDERLTRQL